jgi:GTP cyclohydrolase I
MDTSNPTTDTGIPLSRIIRERLQRASRRFHANDNISAFIEPGELELLQKEVQSKMQSVFLSADVVQANRHLFVTFFFTIKICHLVQLSVAQKSPIVSTAK